MKKPKVNNHCEQCKFINTDTYKAVNKAVCYQIPCDDEKLRGLKAAIEVRPSAIACGQFCPKV